jgi:hypothetical protein
VNNITEPLRLAAGSHQAGSGKGCAMNVISWENGDATISDMPDCADLFLAKVVQRVNDKHCRHVVDGLLCPPCSVEVLALAHRTVGTNIGDTARGARVQIAREEANSVAHLRTYDAATTAATYAAYAAYAARTTAATDAYAADAAYAAADAAYAARTTAATDAYAADAAYAAGDAAYAAAAADADAARTKVRRQCAKLVRARIPWTKVAAAIKGKE